MCRTGTARTRHSPPSGNVPSRATGAQGVSLPGWCPAWPPSTAKRNRYAQRDGPEAASNSVRYGPQERGHGRRIGIEGSMNHRPAGRGRNRREGPGCCRDRQGLVADPGIHDGWAGQRYLRPTGSAKRQATWCDCGGRSLGANEVRWTGLMGTAVGENDRGSFCGFGRIAERDFDLCRGQGRHDRRAGHLSGRYRRGRGVAARQRARAAPDRAWERDALDLTAARAGRVGPAGHLHRCPKGA